MYLNIVKFENKIEKKKNKNKIGNNLKNNQISGHGPK